MLLQFIRRTGNCRWNIRLPNLQIICGDLTRRVPWWRHQMEKKLPLCEGNPPVTSRFPSQKPVTRSFEVFFDLHLNKRLRKQSRRRWFETPLRPLWRHCNDQDRSANNGRQATCLITPIHRQRQNPFTSATRFHRTVHSAVNICCAQQRKWAYKFSITHLSLDKMAAISQMTFSDEF